MPNRYYCKLTDRHYTQTQIEKRLSDAYREYYLFEPLGSCEGCGSPATCTAHICPKARCKTLHIVSMIWNPENWFRSCTRCNMVAENVSSDEILELLNIDRIKEVIQKYDPERASKFKL